MWRVSYHITNESCFHSLKVVSDCEEYIQEFSNERYSDNATTSSEEDATDSSSIVDCSIDSTTATSTVKDVVKKTLQKKQQSQWRSGSRKSHRKLPTPTGRRGHKANRMKIKQSIIIDYDW